MSTPENTPPEGVGLPGSQPAAADAGARSTRAPARTSASDDAPGRAPGKDPLRGSVASRTWSALATLAVLLVVLVVFVAQNTDGVPLKFLGWTWHPPLAVALLAAAALGLLLAVTAGSLRIWQLRRRVHREAASR
ncbi:MAG: lipopolysaccharide assembly protein LapA domain-containing protein [Marmoricola sp.]